MTYTLARILSVAVLGAAMTACATVPGDPYYEPGYQQPGYIYGTAQPVYSTQLPRLPGTAPRLLLRRARP